MPTACRHAALTRRCRDFIAAVRILRTTLRMVIHAGLRAMRPGSRHDRGSTRTRATARKALAKPLFLSVAQP